MVASRQNLPSWISNKAAAAVTRVEIDGNVPDTLTFGSSNEETVKAKLPSSSSSSDANFGERAFSAAGAAVFSAAIVNPFDVAKTRLQAQAAGVPYQGICAMAGLDTNTVLADVKCALSCTNTTPGLEAACASECNRYKGTLDVFYKVTRQEGFGRLWRGTNASLAPAVPTVGIYLPCYDVLWNLTEDFTSQHAPVLTPYVPLVAGSVARSLACVACYPVELAKTRMQAFTEIQTGVKPAGVLKTLIEVINPIRSMNNHQQWKSYRILWTGLGAQLARDVPFSAICWSTLEPIRRRLLALASDEARAGNVLGANFSAGFVAGTLAAAATCPLDVARTRRQIEKDPARALNMTTRQTLLEIWRDGGLRGLFTGVGPRVARAGPSVGIVVSFYEVVKYTLHHRRESNN